MSRYLCLCFCVIVLVSLAGCGKGAAVTGTVTFDDGTPLGVGMVVFESGSNSFSGKIQDNGTYSLTGATLKEGVTDGTYKVTIAQAFETSVGADGNPNARNLIDAKYALPETSELSCTVKGKTTFDIKVSKPKQ